MTLWPDAPILYLKAQRSQVTAQGKGMRHFMWLCGPKGQTQNVKKSKQYGSLPEADMVIRADDGRKTRIEYNLLPERVLLQVGHHNL